MTAEDLWNLGDSGNCRRELIRGELHEMPPTGEEHGGLLLRLGGRLEAYVHQNQLGKAVGGDPGFILSRDPDLVLAPDIAFVRASRLAPDRDQVRFFQLSPDLAVEIISPSESSTSVAAKVMMYLKAGVQVVWEVQPRLKTVTVHYPDYTAKTLTTDDYLDGGEVLPGFRIAVSEIFR
jgi:Uma2 family endonuclease